MPLLNINEMTMLIENIFREKLHYVYKRSKRITPASETLLEDSLEITFDNIWVLRDEYVKYIENHYNKSDENFLNLVLEEADEAQRYGLDVDLTEDIIFPSFYADRKQFAEIWLICRCFIYKCEYDLDDEPEEEYTDVSIISQRHRDL